MLVPTKGVHFLLKKTRDFSIKNKIKLYILFYSGTANMLHNNSIQNNLATLLQKREVSLK